MNMERRWLILEEEIKMQHLHAIPVCYLEN